MGCWAHDSLITFNNGLGVLGPIKINSGGAFLGESMVGDVLGGNFVWRGPKPLLK